MRIAVLADTHDRLPSHVHRELAGAEEIWHLGDVCTAEILDELAEHGRPLRYVRGNCDEEMAWPLTLDFTLEGFRIHLVHIPPPKAPPGTDLLLHGHTHVPRQEMVGVAGHARRSVPKRTRALIG